MKHPITRLHNGLTVVALLLVALPVQPSDAAVILEFSPEGGSTRLRISGTLNTTGISFSGPFDGDYFGMTIGNQMVLTITPGGYRGAEHGQSVPVWHGFLDFNTASDVPVSDFFGGDFAINGENIGLPENYVSGGPLESSVRIDDIPISTINPQPGVILTLANGDWVEVRVVPEPSLPLLLSLGAIAAVNRRNRKPNKAALLTPAPPRVQFTMAAQPSTHSRSRAQGQV